VPNINPVLRDITQEDTASVLEVYRRCEDFLALGPAPKASIDMVIRDIEECRNEGGVFHGIYLHNDQIIGVAACVPAGFEGNPDVAFIGLLMISAPYRQRGIGTEVVRCIEKEIHRNSRITTILSSVQVNNPDAIKFWQKNDYKIISGPELRPDKTTVYRLGKVLD